MLNTEVKVGIFGVIFLAAFLFVVLTLGKFNFGKYYPIYVVFTDVSGLPAKSPVQIRGVKVGLVDRIDLADNKVRVKIMIKKDLKIYSNCQARIESTGVIGSKYLDLTTGTSDAQLLGAGDKIEGIPQYSMESILKEAISAVGKITDAVDVIAGNGDVSKSRLGRILQNIEQATAKINKGLGADENNIRQIIDSLKVSAENIRDVSSDINEIVSTNKDDINSDIVKISQIVDSMNRSMQKIENIISNVEKGEGMLGQLVANTDTKDDMKDIVANIKKATENVEHVTNRIGGIKLEWDANVRYNARDSITRSDFGIRIVPNENKYYLLQINNMKGDNAPNYDEGNQKTNTFTGLMNRDFGAFSIYGGAIKSTGGVGAKYRPANSKKVEFDISAYRFDRKIRDDDVAWIDFYARIKIFNWLYTGLGVEDVAAYSSPTGYVNLVLEDKDLSYLLGLAGLSAAAK